MGERADRLAAALDVGALTGAARVLAEQAVTQTRRLEELALFLDARGDAWMRLRQLVNAEDIQIRIDIAGPLREERETALALGTTLERLSKLTGKVEPAPVRSALDELAEARAKRLAVNE